MDKPMFSYGSNLSFRGMESRAPSARPYTVAHLRDWVLTFRGVADVERAKGEQVAGALWLVDGTSLDAIDQYEGAPWYYSRQDVLVHTPSGRPIWAFTYVMNDQDEWGLPSKYYLDTIVDGYVDWDLDFDSLEHAYERTRKKHEDAGVSHYVERGLKRLEAVWV